MKQIVTLAAALIALCYPFVVYFGLRHYSPRIISGILLFAYLARLIVTGGWKDPLNRYVAVLGCILLALPTLLNTATSLLYFPVLINLSLFGAFLHSLQYPPSVIERFARKYRGDLTAHQQAYCRAVTRCWVVMFIFNGSVAFVLAWSSNLEAWTLFNGLIAYVFVAVLFVGEFIYRHWRFRHYVGLPTDPILKRIFPPPDVVA